MAFLRGSGEQQRGSVLSAESDKHRDLHVTLAALAGSKVTLIFFDGREYKITVSPKAQPAELEDGKELWAVDSSDLTPHVPEVKIKLRADELPVDIFFKGDRYVAMADLTRCIYHAEKILKRFDKRIKP